MTIGKEVYTQTDSLVKCASSEDALAITQLSYSKVDSYLYVVTYDHNIIVHRLNDFSLVKQVSQSLCDIRDFEFL